MAINNLGTLLLILTEKKKSIEGQGFFYGKLITE